MPRTNRQAYSAQPYSAHTAALLAAAEESLRAGRPADALPLLQQAAFSNHGDAAIQHDLGFVCLQIGRLADAIAGFEAALAANPRFALASLRLGIALQASGDEAAALAAYHHASTLLPSLADARFRAGALLLSWGRRDEAIAAFRRAAASAPKTSLGRLSNARALLAEDRDTETERALRQLLAVDAGNAAAIDLLGMVLADSGRFEEARACYERSTLAASHLAGSYDDLVRCRRITGEDMERVGRMRDALKVPGLHVEGLLKLHLAMGKARDDLGDFERAMQHFDAADTHRQSLGAFDPAIIETRVDRMISAFTPERIAQAASIEAGSIQAATAGSRDAAPIDTALSIHRTYFNQNVALPTGGDALVATIRATDRLAAHWRAVLPAGRIIELEYEHLVDNPEPVIRRLVAACGLDWNSACLRPEQKSRIVRTPSKWQVRQPISRDSTQAWRRYEAWLGPLAALAP